MSKTASPFTEAVRLAAEAKKASATLTREYDDRTTGLKLKLLPVVDAHRTGININNKDDDDLQGNYDTVFVDFDAAKWLVQALIIAFGIARDEIYVPAWNQEVELLLEKEHRP